MTRRVDRCRRTAAAALLLVAGLMFPARQGTAQQGFSLGVAPTQLDFEYVQGGTVPGSIGLGITNLNGQTPISFQVSVSTQNGGAWLEAVSQAPQSPTNVLVSVKPTNLAPNTYRGTRCATSGRTASVLVPYPSGIVSRQTATTWKRTRQSRAPSPASGN